MPFFDEATRTLTLRIVYDGLGTAGKTTNVQKLHDLCTLHRASPVIAPAVERGRTIYFDWLELNVGLLDDKLSLRCQVLTVPGQFAHAPHRWKLLSTPDAIVTVCDSSPQGVHRGRVGLDFLRELRTRGVCPNVPLIVQANKRDLDTAMPLAQMREALALSDEPMIEATASTGDGVRLTFITALDCARHHARALLREHGTESLAPPQSPDELLAVLRNAFEREGDDAYSVIETILRS